MRARATFAIGVVAVAVAGCGGAGSDQEVKSTFEKVVRELGTRNPAACRMFTKRYALENTGQPNYAAALATCRRHTLTRPISVPAGLRVEKVKVRGDTATLEAVAPGQGLGFFHFVNEGGQWKIDSLTAAR